MKSKFLALATLLTAANMSWAAANVNLAVASNFIPTAEELATAYEPECECKIKLAGKGSTGALYGEIAAGNPADYDVFLAADSSHPKKLEEEGKTLSGKKPVTYAIGQLALWYPEVTHQVTESDLIDAAKYKTLAFAEPAMASYGQAAQETLETLDAWGSDSKHFKIAANTEEAFDWVENGQATAALVPYSLVAKKPKKEVYLIDAADYAPLTQQAVLLQHAKDNSAAEGFVTFLTSNKAKAIIKQHGYNLPGATD